jgi:hypothetical protein
VRGRGDPFGGGDFRTGQLGGTHRRAQGLC